MIKAIDNTYTFKAYVLSTSNDIFYYIETKYLRCLQLSLHHIVQNRTTTKITHLYDISYELFAYVTSVRVLIPMICATTIRAQHSKKKRLRKSHKRHFHTWFNQQFVVMIWFFSSWNRNRKYLSSDVNNCMQTLIVRECLLIQTFINCFKY